MKKMKKKLTVAIMMAMVITVFTGNYSMAKEKEDVIIVTDTQSELAEQYAAKLRIGITEQSKYPIDYEKESKSTENVNWNLLDEERYHFEEAQFHNCRGMILVNNKNADTDKILVMLHGGAFYQGLEDKYLKMAENYSKAYQDAKVLVLDYRLAPENVYPAMVEDVVDAYQTLLAAGYQAKNVVFAGDSAGGSLVLMSAMYLRDNKIELPGALITLSAVTDYTYSRESWTTNAKLSPMLGEHMNKDLIKPIFAGQIPLNDPRISPMYADKSGLPKMLMQVASHECLLSDTVDFAKEARDAGVDVTVEEYYGLFHVFQIAGDLPESDLAWKHIQEFLK